MDPEIQGYPAPPSGGLFKSIKEYIPYIIAVLVIGNLLIINAAVFIQRKSSKTQLSTIAPTTTPPQAPAAVSSDPSLITTQINQATESVRLQILRILSVTPVLTQAVTPTTTPSPTPASVQVTREYFIPLGTGFGSSTVWTTITQLGVTVDTADYPNVKSVVFEASVRIPTGNQTVHVRLLNADTYQSIAGSELLLSGGTPTILVSSPITLTTGSHLYQVQLYTQLGYTTYIDFARLRITTE